MMTPEDVALFKRKQKEKEEKYMIGRLNERQLTKILVSFFNKCLRLIRSYNFTKELVDQVGEYQ